MIRAALIFFLMAFGASVLGVSNADIVTMETGHFLLLVFLALAIVSLCFGMMPTDEEDEMNQQPGRDYDQSIL